MRAPVEQERRANKPGQTKARHEAGLSLQGRFNAYIAWCRSCGVSESRHHIVEAEQMNERLELAPLLVAEAHDHRKARRLESIDIDLAHVDRGHFGALRRLAVGSLAVFHLAQLG